MESACQVKGCKVNKKAAKHIHDDNRSHPKENNNINCSDDENNEDTGRKNNNNNSKKNYKNQTTNNYNTTHNNVSNKHHHNSNSSSSTNNKINSKPVTNDVAYSKVVSSNKPTTNDIAYNKVVSNSYKGITSDLSYNKVVSNGKLTTGTSELGYNKVVSGYKTISADLPYNKVVSSNLPLTLSYPTLSTTTNNKLVSDITLSTGNVTNSLIGSGNSVTNNVISSSSSNLTSNIISSNNITNNLISNNTTNAIISSTINVNSSSKESENVINKDESSSLVSSNVVVNNEKQAQPQQQQQQQQQQPQQLIIKPKGDNEAQQRRAVLSFEQVCRLNDVMNEVVSIHGRGNFPTLEVRLRDLVTVVKSKLEADPSNGGAGMKVRDIRLNGGAASHVLATESQPYNDLDLIFGVELTGGRNYDKVKAAVLGSLFDLLPEGVSRKRMTTCSLKEAYVSKMVKVNNDGDRWSLISLGNSRGHRNVELKFVDTMRRQFEFSVDSFQIVLDSLLMFHENNKNLTEFTENFYPTVVGESVYGDFHEALYHLQKKLISTRHPEEIRGGGLLKYCNLLVKMYKAAQPDYIKTLERYMCSRFFIDFPDIGQQKAKLENYLWNHFVGPEEETLKYQYLMLLHSVVEESTVCLMGHERRQTLALIESLAFQVLCQEQQQRLTNHQAPTAYVYANGYYYTPVIPTACYPCVCNSWMACSS